MDYRRAITGILLSFIFFGFFVSATVYSEPALRKLLAGSGQASLLEGARQITAIATPTPEVLQINARAAFSVETDFFQDRIIFGKSFDFQLPIASLTKLMTAVIVLDNYDLSVPISISETADTQSSMIKDLGLGDTKPVESLLEIMLVTSSNKAAYALSEQLGVGEFVALMNEKAKFLGLENTRFNDPTGLSKENVSTAQDITVLAMYILKNYSKISDIGRQREIFIPGLGLIENTNTLLKEMPTTVFSKTGFTPVADGCLLVVTRDTASGKYLINIVLGAEDRFSEMRKLLMCSNKVCN